MVVAYGLILPKPILDAPRLGCFNLHASALPRWRGAAPINRAIMAGDTETAVMAMKMEEGLDTGPIAGAERVAIDPDMTAGELHDRLSRLGADLMVRTLGALERGSLQLTPQPDEGVTYAHKLGKEEGLLDWRRPAAELERKVRAFHPWPGTSFELNGERIKVLEAALALAGGAPGTVAIGRDARIAYKPIGPITPDNLDQALKPELEKALAAPASSS